jgi:hypothetical protein
MKLRTIFRGGDLPFEGDIHLELRGLPVDAQIVRGTARVAPLPSIETIPLGATPPYLWGVTKEGGTVDFHARRVVSQVKIPGTTPGTTSGTVHVQLDMGGVWVTLNNDGTLAVPQDGKSREFAVNDGVVSTRNVVTSRIQVSQGNNMLDIQEVTWHSFPTNVSLRIGEQGPFWFQTGELRTEVTTPDFAEPLRAYLLGAQAENGHTLVPFTLHSDAIARLEVTLEIEYLRRQILLPSSVREVVLPFTYEPLPRADPNLLTVALPATAQAMPGVTTAQAVGTFEPSRIVIGPTMPVHPTAVVRVSTASSQAQPIRVPTDLLATAVDLLLEPLAQTVTLSVTLLADADGKPWGESLLARPVAIRLDQQVSAGLSWVSAPLPTEFQFKSRGPDGQPRRYWLVVTSAEGEVSWGVQPQTDDAAGLHHSQDNGLSWQAAAVQRMPGPVAGFLRLRHTPTQFQMPIQLQVGQGEKARLVSLERLQPLGRVDFPLDFPEVADAFNRYLADAAPTPCPEGEHLANGDFKRWIEVNQQQQIFHPEEWELTSGQVRPFTRPSSPSPSGTMPISGAVIAGTESQPGALSQVAPVADSCQYQFEFVGLARDEGVVGEVIWLGENCSAVHIDRVPFVVLQQDLLTSVELSPLELHRVRLQAPVKATQAEVRFLVPARNAAIVERVSLVATAEAVANSDLRQMQEGRLANWTVTPEEAIPGQAVKITSATAGVIIENTGSRMAALVQRIAVRAAQPYILAFQGQAVKQPEQDFIQLELRWLKEDNSPAGVDTVQSIGLTSFDRYLVEGTVPDQAAQVEVRLVVPARATLEVGRISLRTVEFTTIPITFLAQAPGELRVSQAQVTYDLVRPPLPSVPSAGLCTPTPSGQESGARPENHCFCSCCETERPLRDTTPAVTPAGRPAVVGVCRVCDTGLVRLGGPLVGDAQPISLPRLPVHPHIVLPSTIHPSLTVPPLTSTVEVAAMPPVTVISGIGQQRARRLEESGIDSIQKLATAAPQDVARLLLGVSVEMAVRFIEDARRLLESGREP